MAFFDRRFQELVLENQRTIIKALQEIKKHMADNQEQNQLSFADVQASVTQLVNDNTQQNNAVASQIKEVQRLIGDFAAKSNQGNSPSQADFQSVIAQLASVHSLVSQNTAQIQATAAQIQDADPSQASASSDSGTSSSASGTGNAAASSQSGGSLEPGTGELNQTPAGPEHVGENSSSGTGELSNQV